MTKFTKMIQSACYDYQCMHAYCISLVNDIGDIEDSKGHSICRLKGQSGTLGTVRDTLLQKCGLCDYNTLYTNTMQSHCGHCGH